MIWPAGPGRKLGSGYRLRCVTRGPTHLRRVVSNFLFIKKKKKKRGATHQKRGRGQKKTCPGQSRTLRPAWRQGSAAAVDEALVPLHGKSGQLLRRPRAAPGHRVALSRVFVGKMLSERGAWPMETLDAHKTGMPPPPFPPGGASAMPPKEVQRVSNGVTGISQPSAATQFVIHKETWE